MSRIASRLADELRDARVRAIWAALEQAHGDVSRAAILLDVHRATLHRWLDEYAEELSGAPRQGREAVGERAGRRAKVKRESSRKKPIRE